MHVIPLACLYQAEVIDHERWNDGPLELVFVNERTDNDVVHELGINRWNTSFRSGLARPADAMDVVATLVPRILSKASPNLFLVPSHLGYSELHAMLASVIPAPLLTQHGIEKMRANFFLSPLLLSFIPFDEMSEYDDPAFAKEVGRRAEKYANASVAAFEEFIWTKLANRRETRKAFSSTAPLRLLAGDSRFWMSRFYRIALARAEELGETRARKEDKWTPLAKLRERVFRELPSSDRTRFEVRRPLNGGYVWDQDDPAECEAIVEEAISGNTVLESLNPVIEALRSDRCHEDFSDHYSWVKEDFERSFYSKRSRTKVTLVETVDDLPVWASDEAVGYENILFRDVISFFDARDRHIIIALRQGKTRSEVATELGYRGHAVVSRRLQVIKERIRNILLK